jgi:hypothetical protein
MSRYCSVNYYQNPSNKSAIWKKEGNGRGWGKDMYLCNGEIVVSIFQCFACRSHQVPLTRPLKLSTNVWQLDNMSPYFLCKAQEFRGSLTTEIGADSGQRSPFVLSELHEDGQ